MYNNLDLLYLLKNSKWVKKDLNNLLKKLKTISKTILIISLILFPILHLSILNKNLSHEDSENTMKDFKPSKNYNPNNLPFSMKFEYKNDTTKTITYDGKETTIKIENKQNYAPKGTFGNIHADVDCDGVDIDEGGEFNFVIWEDSVLDAIVYVYFVILIGSDVIYELEEDFDWWLYVYKVTLKVWWDESQLPLPSNWAGQFYYAYCIGVDFPGDEASDETSGWITPIPPPLPPDFPIEENPEYDVGFTYPEEGELPPWLAWKGTNFEISFDLTNTQTNTLFYNAIWEERQLSPVASDWAEITEDYRMIALPSGETDEIKSPTRRYDWEWFTYGLGELVEDVMNWAPLPQTWDIIAETERDYEYRMTINQLDGTTGEVIQETLGQSTMETNVAVHPSHIAKFHAAQTLYDVGFGMKLTGFYIALTPEPTFITKAIAAAIYGAGAVLCYVASDMADSARDPPDPNYNEIFEPRDLIYTPIEGDETLVNPVNNLLENTFNVAKYSEAVKVTTFRYDTATQMKDVDALALQAGINQLYSQNLNDGIMDLTNSIEAFKDTAEEAGYFREMNAEECNQYVDYIADNGFPQEFEDQFLDVGYQFNIDENDLIDIETKCAEWVVEDDPEIYNTFDGYINEEVNVLTEAIHDIAESQLYASLDEKIRQEKGEWLRVIETALGVKSWADYIKQLGETDYNWGYDFKNKLQIAIGEGQSDLSSFRTTLNNRVLELKNHLIKAKSGLETMLTLIIEEIERNPFTVEIFIQLKQITEQIIPYISNEIVFCDTIASQATSGDILTAANNYISLVTSLKVTGSAYSSSLNQIVDNAKNQKDSILIEATPEDLNQLISLNSSVYLAIEELRWNDARTLANSLISKASEVIDYTSNYKYLEFLSSGREALRIIEEAIEFTAILDPLINDIEPGYTKEYNLTIKNTGTASDIYAITLTYNYFPGVIDLTQNEIGLEPGEVAQISIFVTPQRHYLTEPGIYDFNITIQSLSDILEIKTIQGKINVTAFHEVQIHIEPEFLEGYPGDQISYNIFVQNLGNIQENYTISFEGLDFNGAYMAYPTLILNAWVDIFPNLLTLNPAEIQTVELIISIPLNWSGFEVSTYQFLAIATCDLDPNTKATSLGELAIKNTFTSSVYYVDWLLGEINKYIYSNSIVALYGVVTQKIVKIQSLVWEAYQLIQDGYLHTGLVRQKMAEIKLEIAETKTELMIYKQSMSPEHFEHLQEAIRNVRNKIIELMGLSINEFSHDISLVEIDVYNLKDFVEDNILATDSENLVNAITLTAEKLENAIFDISLGKDTEESLTSAQNALDKAKTEVVALAAKGKISEELKTTLLMEMLLIQVEIELLKQVI